MPPRVSVVIPTYNAAQVIGQAIDSVLSQTYTDLEVIVVDDGSTDNTRERLAAYGDRVQSVHQANCGRSAARNRGIRLARGEYVAFLDADDCWLPHKLERQMALFDRQPNLALIYSWAQAFYADYDMPLILGADFASADEVDVLEGLLLGKSLPILTVIAKAQCLREAGLFDEELVIGEDWDIWLRVALKHKVNFVPEVLARYRLSGKFLPRQWAQHQAQDTRLKSVRRIFDLAQADPGIHLRPGLEDQALANAWWYGSLIDYAIEDVASGAARLAHALEHDANFFLATPAWIESLIGFAMHQIDTGTPPAEAEALVGRVFDHLPESAWPLQRFRRQALGQLKAGYAFRAQSQKDRLAARTLMWRAVRFDPSLLRNLGIVSICLQDTWADRLKRRIRPVRAA